MIMVGGPGYQLSFDLQFRTLIGTRFTKKKYEFAPIRAALVSLGTERKKVRHTVISERVCQSPSP